MEELLHEEDSLGTVTLTLDNDQELECEILTIYTAAGRQYIALAPQDESLEEVVYLYRYIDNGEDADPDLELIEDDEEYEIASDGFEEWMDTMEYEELLGDE